MPVDDARTAIQQGAQGLVVSDHGGLVSGGGALPVEALPAVADAVNSQVPILVDGSFRRGTDLLKGLALGATAVMVARPPMWGLAAYGAEGVRALDEFVLRGDKGPWAGRTGCRHAVDCQVARRRGLRRSSRSQSVRRHGRLGLATGGVGERVA